MRALVALAGTLTILAGLAEAGPVANACLSAGRAADRPTCACIQNAADMTLDRSDQRLAARLFADPEKAEEIRISERSRNKAFWARYRSFAEAAGALCAAG